MAPLPSDAAGSRPAVQAALDEIRATRHVPAIDGTVQQGNRVTTAAEQVPTDPVRILKDRITDFFFNSQRAIADLRAAVDEIEHLAERLKIGL